MASSSARTTRPASSRGFFDSVIDAWRHATGPAEGGSPGTSSYGARKVPYPLMSQPVSPLVNELSRLLDRQRARDTCRHLQMVEQTLRLERGSFDLVPAPLLRAAHRELQSLTRRAAPTPALARLLDVFERRLIDVEIRSFIERTSERPMSRAPSSQESRPR
jgi:hypothetical protein